MRLREMIKDEALDQFFRDELIEQLVDFESTMDKDSIRDTTLVEAFKQVIAYNSVAGTYEEGKYDK